MKKMKETPLRILYLDARQEYKYIIFQRGITIHSRVTLRQAGTLLKTIPIDLVFFQRQRLAVYLQNFLPEMSPTLRKTIQRFLSEEEQQAA